jgi:hypothetical protein
MVVVLISAYTERPPTAESCGATWFLHKSEISRQSLANAWAEAQGTCARAGEGRSKATAPPATGTITPSCSLSAQTVYNRSPCIGADLYPFEPVRLDRSLSKCPGANRGRRKRQGLARCTLMEARPGRRSACRSTPDGVAASHRARE